METNVEFSEQEPLEPLFISEDGDSNTEDAMLRSCGEDASALEQKEEHPGEEENDETHSEELKLEKRQSGTEEEHSDPHEAGVDGEGRDDGLNSDRNENEEQTQGNEAKEEKTEWNGLNSCEKQPEGEKHQEDTKKAHRLTPDFPDSLFELLCTLQEGRRLNDQRCSFRLEGGIRRRRCHSEPNTRKPTNRVVFSSMTSLQKEEFFDLVATAQARRLDDQRAQLGRSLPPKSKSRSFRGSLKQLSLVKKTGPEPVPVPKDDLYDMILTTQAQGRLEDQRSRAPGPMDDDDFFSLLLKVQGGRMDEQRTELPRLLKT